MKANRRFFFYGFWILAAALCVLPLSCGGGGNKGGGTAVRVNTPAVVTQPTPVTLSSPTNITASSATLSWSKNNDTDFVSYKVYYGTTSGIYDTLAATITNQNTVTSDVTGLASSSTYYFKVVVLDNEGGSAWSTNEVVVNTTYQAGQAPLAVTLSAPSTVTDTSMNLTWTQNTNSDFLRYKVLYSLTSGGALTTLATITDKTTTTYTASGLTASTQYYFKVYVYDTESLYAASNEVNATTLQNQPPPAVTLNSPSSITDTSMSLTWTQNNDSDFLKYKVLYSLTSGGALTTLTEITTKTTTTFSAAGLTLGTKYYFKVYVYDTGGLYAASNEVNATTLTQWIGPVTLSEPEYITSSSMKLTWTPNNDSDFLKYKVLYSLTSGGTLTTLTEITTKSVAAFYATGLTSSTRYYFKVYVYDTGGASAASNEVNATTLQNQPPAAVTLNAPSYITTSSMKLTWTQNNDSDFLKYKVLYSLTSGGTLTTLTEITIKSTAAVYVTGLAPLTKYYFKVYVYDTGGLYAGSNEVNATTLNAAPTGVTLSSPAYITSSSMKLTWTQNNDSDFLQYKVFYSLTSGGTLTSLTTITTKSVAAFYATGLTPSTKYYFKVYVYDTGGLYAQSINEVNATTLNAAPIAVNLSSPPTLITSSSMKLTWTQNNDSDFSSYKVYYSLTSNGTLTRLTTITNKSTVTYTAMGLNSSTKYYFKVYVYDTGGLYAGSNEVSGTTLSNGGQLRKTAFASNRDGSWEIYTVNEDGSSLAKITSMDCQAIMPVFNHNGSAILFTCGIMINPPNLEEMELEYSSEEIYRVNIDGTGLERLTNNSIMDYVSDVSSDGSKILYVSGCSSYLALDCSNMIMNYDGTNPVAITTNTWGQGNFSTDNNKIFYIDSSDPPFGYSVIFSRKTDGTEVTRITPSGVYEDEEPNPISANTILFVNIVSGDSRIARMNIDGTNRYDIINSTGDNDAGIGISADYSKLCFSSNRDGNYEIYIANVDGTGQTRITNNVADDFSCDIQ